MMHDMMDERMWGMGLISVLVILVLILLVAALVRYVIFR